MEPVGQARRARSACRRSAGETGWALTYEVSAACPKTAGAICRQASQSMQVESTKKSPGTFSGTRFLTLAMTRPFPGGLLYSNLLRQLYSLRVPDVAASLPRRLLHGASVH